MEPAAEWLSKRLERSTATFRELKDEALPLGFGHMDLIRALKALKAVKEERAPDATGRPWVVYKLPKYQGFKPGVLVPNSRNTKAPIAAADVTDAPIVPKVPNLRRDPKAQVEAAINRLKRKSVRHVRALEEMAERAMRDEGAKCPTCQRGSMRDENVRLKAIVAALDRGGVPAGRTAGEAETASGPVIMFPPGTKVAIMAAPVEGLSTSTLTRASDLGRE